jgi:hypothetical protein
LHHDPIPRLGVPIPGRQPAGRFKKSSLARRRADPARSNFASVPICVPPAERVRAGRFTPFNAFIEACEHTIHHKRAEPEKDLARGILQPGHSFTHRCDHLTEHNQAVMNPIGHSPFFLKAPGCRSSTCPLRETVPTN